MDSNYAFSPMEIDAIGEILNISLGASATAVSTMLNTRVDITTPKVKVAAAEEFTFRNLQPAIGVEITYIDGLDGKNIMLLKRSDIKIIVELLMGMEIPDEEFELDEMNVSAVCEVMNQMMGASSTALSEFLGRTVNISTPVSFEIDSEDEFKQKYFVTGDTMIIVDFLLRIEGKLESEFLNVMTPELAKELLAGFLPDDYVTYEEEKTEEAPQTGMEGGSTGGQLTQEQIDQMASGGSTGGQLTQAQIDQMASGGSTGGQLTQAQIDQMASGGSTGGQLTQAQIDQMASGGSTGGQLTQAQIDQMSMGSAAPAQQIVQPQMMGQPGMTGMAAGQVPGQAPVMAPVYGPDPMMLQQMNQQQLLIQQMMEQMTRMQSELADSKRHENKMMSARPLDYDGLSGSKDLGQEQQENLDLIMGVTMDVSVEIGRTRSYVKDILEYTKGTLVVLDKQAGDPVDLYVNGQCIAKGEVVVVDDNFGIRISEVLKSPDNE